MLADERVRVACKSYMQSERESEEGRADDYKKIKEVVLTRE